MAAWWLEVSTPLAAISGGPGGEDTSSCLRRRRSRSRRSLCDLVAVTEGPLRRRSFKRASGKIDNIDGLLSYTINISSSSPCCCDDEPSTGIDEAFYWY